VAALCRRRLIVVSASGDVTRGTAPDTRFSTSGNNALQRPAESAGDASTVVSGIPMQLRTAIIALFALLVAGASTASAAERKVVLKLKSKPAETVKHDMNDDGVMGAGDVVVYKPTPLYNLQGKKVGERGVVTTITSDPDATGQSMAQSQVNLYFSHGNTVHETLYAKGYFNGGGHPLRPGDVWRRAVIGGTGKYMGARGEDVVRYRGDWVYFTLTMYLP
jgi:hypothetical protein